MQYRKYRFVNIRRRYAYIEILEEDRAYEQYETPSIELIALKLVDILTTSTGNGIIDEDTGITIPGGF